MKRTLQDQYLLIKEGKGHKDVFMKEAKTQFPGLIRNAATFNEIATVLKDKNIINENIVGLEPINQLPGTKKESFETAFENFLKEAKDTYFEDEKAEVKKTSKQVEDDLSHNFDRADKSNPDNMIFDQIMKGYYTEMKDPKNADKTMEQLKAIVLKNLEKNPIYYTEKGQFGVKDLGYTTEAPGLGTPKEPKGKYASSGYGNLNESVNENQDGGVYLLFKNNKLETIMFTNDMKPDDKLANSLKSSGYEALFTSDSRFSSPNSISKYQGKNKEELGLTKSKESLEEQKIRKVIRESIEKELAAINKEAELEVLDSKLEKIEAAIEKRNAQLSKLDEDEDMKALTDKKKIKSLEKDIKTLEKAKAKIEKQLSKVAKKNKGANVSKKEVIDEDEPLEEGETQDAANKLKDTVVDIGKTIDDELIPKLEENFSKIKERYPNVPNDIMDDFIKTHSDDLSTGVDPVEEFELFIDANPELGNVSRFSEY